MRCRASLILCGGFDTAPVGAWRLTRQSRGVPRPAAPLGRGPRPFPRSPLRGGRESSHSAYATWLVPVPRSPRPGKPPPLRSGRYPGRASGRAVAGKPAFFFIGYARRAGRPMFHFVSLHFTLAVSRTPATRRAFIGRSCLYLAPFHFVSLHHRACAACGVLANVLLDRHSLHVQFTRLRRTDTTRKLH